MRQTTQLASLLAQKHHGRGSRPGGTAMAPNMLSPPESLPGHPAEQEKSLLCLQVSLPLTSSNSSRVRPWLGKPFSQPCLLYIYSVFNCLAFYTGAPRVLNSPESWIILEGSGGWEHSCFSSPSLERASDSELEEAQGWCRTPEKLFPRQMERTGPVGQEGQGWGLSVASPGIPARSSRFTRVSELSWSWKAFTGAGVGEVFHPAPSTDQVQHPFLCGPLAT